MKDEFKKAAEENRADFEAYTTDFDSLWADIEKKTSGQKKSAKLLKIRNFSPMRIAAAVSLFALGTVLLLFLNINRDEDNRALNAAVPAELRDAEQYYSGKIQEKMQIIQSKHSGAESLLNEDMAMLDSAYKDLALDLRDNAANTEVVNAMIQNYRLKLQILEDFLGRLEHQNHENTESRETNL